MALTFELVPTDSALPQYLNKAQLAFISQKTPKQFIKMRPGPGGTRLAYVEVGYVINMLNQKNTGDTISVADDLKAAASDCLKKCASMLGVAGDVYWRDLDNWNSEETAEPSPVGNVAYTQRVAK